MAESPIRPTEGEFDLEEDRATFAKKYFWKLLIKTKLLDDLMSKLIPRFNQDLTFPENQRNLRDDITNWQKENCFFNQSETNWLGFWIFHLIEFRAKFSELEDKQFQVILARDGVQRYAPTTKGLQVWLFDCFSKEEYIESQRLQAIDDLNETNLSSLPQHVKTYVADERAKQARSYTKQVEAKRKIQDPSLKSTVISRKYSQHFKWLLQIYVEKFQIAEVATLEDVDQTNVSREVARLAALLGFVKPLHINRGRKKGSRNNAITPKLGK